MDEHVGVIINGKIEKKIGAMWINKVALWADQHTQAFF
jgi:hypothetical protein